MKRKFTIVILALGLLIAATGNVYAEQVKKPTACDLKSDMRKLWEDHIIWTRNVILNIIDELPGTTEAVNRLLQNQVDIGNAIKPYYGTAAGNQLTALLHDHITIAADLLTALDDGNTAAFNTAWTLWLANGDAIAAFLSAANPNWPLAEMQAMMLEHLNATAAEALARKNGNYAGDVTAFENVHLQVLEMADMLTEGIVKQFPNMFSGCSSKDAGNDQVPVTRIILNQNIPNPFSDKTVISFFIPEDVDEAQIVVHNDMGILVKTFNIKSRGEGNITFYANNLRKGLYSYSVIADGKLIDSKKMIH
jgi:hypothetical protein